MEVEVDLASIRDEELLRRMWQQSEDFGRKKDIRQHLYKLREARLREFYTIGTDIMDCPTGQGINIKSSLTPSHGDSLADQSFQSFKTKEIRDSESPTKDMKFAQQQLHNIRDGSICVKPDTSGWNVVTSSEVNPDGKGYKTETLATTEGVRKIDGGQTEFAGKNEHMQKASHHGDDKNFVKTAAESSNTHLQESSVVGDEQSGRIEKKSSTTVSSSSKSFVSKSTTGGGDDGGYDDNYLDSNLNAISNRRDSTQSNTSVNSNMSNQQQRQLSLQEKLQQTRKNVESRSTTSVREEEHHHEEHQRQHEQKRYQEEVEQQNIRRQQHQDERIIREQQHQQHHQQQKNSPISKDAQRYMNKYTDKDGVTYTKSPVINQDSPAELQREFQRLETQPGRIISRTVEYPKPNVKMIVEKKELADGTIITSRNYETEGTPTVTETQKKVVSGSHKVEEGGSYKISITKGSTDDDQHQFTKNVDQRSRQILRDTDRKLTNTNERNITNRTITSDERENTEREFQQNRVNVTEEMINQDRINQTRQIKRDREEFLKQFNQIDINKDKARYEREFQEWRNTNRDTVDRGVVTNIRNTARDHVENLKDQIETFDIHKTVKKDLSQTTRKENISSQDFIQTESGCEMIDRNNISRRPEKIISAPTNQYDDCYEHSESQTSKKETYNNIVQENEDDYHPRSQTPRKQQRPEKDFGTHGFPSQRLDNDSKDIYTTNEQYENRTERIKKTQDFSTHGFPSVRDPSPKKPFDHSPTQSTGKQSTPEFTSPGRTHKDDKPDFTTHGFPSARVPTDKKIVDHGPIKSPHDKKSDQSFSTHGFPSVRDPTPKKPVDHGPVRSPNSKHPNQDFSTHGFPSVGTSNNKKPSDQDYTSTKSPHGERPSQDFTTKNGFPSAREPTSTKRIEENITEVKKTNQYQTKAQQKTTEKKTEMYTSTESLRREKKTDAAHDAFARSLRCASPVEMPRRDSNASQKSTSYRTHSVQTSRGSTPTYRAPTTTSKLKTREVHQSNETIDLGSPHHHVDDLKRRGTSKTTTTTTTTTTRARDSSGEIQKKKISPLNRQNKDPVYEPKITKKTIIEDDRFVGAEEIIEEPIVKTEYKQLCPDSCPLPKRFDEITEITKDISPENYGAKRFAKSPTRNYMEPTESQINRVSKNFEEEHLRINSKSNELESENKKVVFSNRETSPTREKSIPRNKSSIRDNSSTPQKNIPKQHYLEPTESQISRVSKNIETYMEGIQSVPIQRASSPNRKSSPTRETSPNRKASPNRSSTIISNKSIEKTQSSEEYNNQHQNYSKPYTILGPVPINPVGYVSKKVSSEITTNTDFKEIDDSKVTYPGFLKKSKSKSPKGSPRASPERTSSRKGSPQPNDKLPYSTKNQPYDSSVTNRKSSEPVSQREPYHVPQYDSPKSKPTSVHPQSTSPNRTTTFNRDQLTSKTTKTNKFDSTVICDDNTYDNDDNSKPSHPQEPHYASPLSKPTSRHPQSTSPERSTISRDNLRTKTMKTNKFDSTVICDDTTYDNDDNSKTSHPKEPHYASPLSKPTSRHPQSTSPERSTISRDNLRTKTTKTNKFDSTVISDDTTYDYDENSKPLHPQEPHYASPLSKPTYRHPQSTSPERSTISRDNLRTKTTKTNKFDSTVTCDDTTYDYDDNSKPSHPQEPHYASPLSKPTSRHPQSTSPERSTISRDNLRTKTTKTNKFDSTVTCDDTTYDYDDNSKPSHPQEPHYASPLSKPTSRHPQSTSPERSTISRDNLRTKTTKTNKFDSTITCDDTTYDYDDNSKPSHPQEPHYASPLSKPTSRHPQSTSPERSTISKDNLRTTTTKINKMDSTVTREDTTYDYEDNNEPSGPRQPNYATSTTKPTAKYPKSTSPERTTFTRDDLRTTTTKKNTDTCKETTYDKNTSPSHPQEPHYSSPTSKPTSKHPQSTSPERTTIVRDDLRTKTTKVNKFDSSVTHDGTTYDNEDYSEPEDQQKPHYSSPKSKPTTRQPQSASPERTSTKTDDVTKKTTITNKFDSTETRENSTYNLDDNSGPLHPQQPHYSSKPSKPTYKHPQSSPERIPTTRDDFTTNTTKAMNSTVTREDTTYNSSEPLRPQEPRYASPVKKHPQSTSPERTTITRDGLTTKSTKINKSDTMVTREDIAYDHEDNVGPSCPREPRPTGYKSKPESKSPQSKSPERTTYTKNDSTTQFTDFTKKTTVRDKTKKSSIIDKEYHTSDDEGIEPESPRTGSPTSDFEYRRNVETKSKNISTATFKDSLKNHKTAVNTEFITNEKENVYREISPEHEKYRPRSTTQEYFHETEKVENLRYPSSKSPEDNKPKEPFFLRENPQDEKECTKVIDESIKPKPKAPFNRSETFEQRCRQVLGINETNEINESKSVITTHHNTSDFIDNEKTYEDINKVTKSSSPSPVPSPRSTSPRKTTPKPDDEPNTAYEKFIKHEKTTTTKKHAENTRSVSPGYSPTRKTSPQRVKPTKFTGDESYVTKTTTRQEHYLHSPKDSPSGSPYSRSPDLSPVRGPTNRRRSPDKISKITSKKDYHRDSYITSDKTTHNEGQQENETHISVAKIKISPSGPKTYIPDSNHVKPQKVKPSPVSNITTTRSTISSNRNATKSTSRKISPDNSRPKKSVPHIHKKSDSEYDKESDIVSDNEDVITTTTTKITKTTTKKNSPNKKQPVFERKESAPVYRSTHIDRDQKMTRSTSDNILKTPKRIKPLDSDKPQYSAGGPKSPRKSSLDNKKDLKTEKRPNKCLTTKTINLSTKSNIINSEDMENVIIDIQQAKSSREPSPNKMVPVPVPLNEDTGKPRYPDRVQEPEEDRRRSRVKNIPIYEEAKDDFIGCQITEVAENEEEYLNRKHLSKKLFTDEQTTIQSSSEINRNTTFDEDCLLSVHDKVSKFINTAEEVKKPKPSAPFQRDVPQMNFPEDDDCLLSVNDKVNKFLTTAEKVTNNVITSTGKIIEKINVDEIDKNLREDECILSVSQKVNKFINTAEKLTETQPQKSPELVARIEKQISRQSDDDINDDDIITTKSTTVKSRITERYTPDKPKREPVKSSAKPIIKSTDAVRKAKSVFEKNDLKDVNLTKTTTTTKQRDILSRPSVWEAKKNETIENRKNLRNRTDAECKTPRTTKPVSLSRDLATKTTDIYDNTVITSKTEISTKAEDVTARLTRKTTPRRPSDTQSSKYPDKKTHTVDKRTEYSNEYTNKFGNRRPKEHSPNRSPVRECATPKHPMESKTEYSDEYTDKYGFTEKNISKKISSSSITSKRFDEKSPEQSPTRVSRKPAEFSSSPISKKPETYTPSWSRNMQPKQSSPTRLDGHSPTRVTSSYVEENTTVLNSTRKGDHSPTRPSTKPVSTQHKYPDDHSPARSVNRYTEENKNYRTSTTRNGAPSPSIQDRKYLFENIEPNTPRPSYMDHTKASLEHIRRDSLEINRSSYNRRVSVDEESFDGNPRSAVKFGVDLKHHDETRPRRKSSSPDIPHVEEIFDLNLLEQMLTVVVGYEQRRRIRSQIRIVKKMIEQRNKEEAQIAYIRETSPARRSVSSERENSITRENIRNKTTDEQIAYIRETSPVRRSSPTRSITSTSSQKKNIRTKSSSSFIERESKHIEKHETTRDRSPQSKIRTTKTVTEFRKVGEKPLNKTKSVPLKDTKTDDKPIWATKNILKKPSENNLGPKSTTTKKSHTSTIKTTQSQRQKISSDEDCITSSYGIGPTDEDGRPLFGIRALKKKQQPSETSKVTGTVITENFYSENGSAPVGERKITVYSSNPNDIDQYESKYDHTKRSGSIKRESSKQNGLTSVTRTQKFGGDLAIEDMDYPALTDDLSTSNTKSSKVIRKGSVKEMSEKFIRKESSSSVTEKTTSSSSTSYPKSTSNIRTQITNRETTPVGQRSYENDVDEYDYEYDNSTRHSQLMNESENENESCNVRRTVNKSSKSFLNTSGSKVTGVDDVLERMRNADHVIEDGDTLEDQEARALLNKFLGASVLMSGVESSMVPKEVVTRKTIKVEGGPGCTQEVKTTRVTKTIKTEGNSSSPVAQQTCDIEEIWDIEFLKELLEQSTSYEERSKIRARIKQLMAEREACAEIVASVKAELQSSNAKKQPSKLESKKIITTKKEEVEEEEEEEEEVSDDDDDGEEEVEEVDGDSSSEYEEIIVEVTDSEDDDDDNQIEETDNKKTIVKSVVETKVEPKQQQQQQLSSDNKKIIKTTTIIKTDNTNKDNKKEGKNIKNIDEDLSEGGDSLLLPLLQGLLHKNMPPITNNQTTKMPTNTSSNNNNNYSSNNPKNNKLNNNNNNSDSNKLVNNTKKTSQIMNTQIQQKNQINTNKSISSSSLTNNNINKKLNSRPHPIEDSGTESGEDLRLIAAGLRDTMQMHSIKDPNDTGLISEVTTALNRLEQSLKEGKHIKLENSKRNALLNLVGRLQTGLISPDKLPPPTPAPDQTGEIETSSPEADRGSNRQRFAKRRSRANRHTVGVSREELADARRYMEEMVMIENMSSCTTPESSAVTPSDLVTQPIKNEQATVNKPIENPVKQQQAQSQPSGLYRPNQFVPNNLKDTAAGGLHVQDKYNFENTQSGVQMRGKKPKYEPNQRLSGNYDQQGGITVSRRPLSDSYTAALGQQIQNQTYQNLPQQHINVNNEQSQFNNQIHHDQSQFNGFTNQPPNYDAYTSQQSNNYSQYEPVFNPGSSFDQPYDGIYENGSPNNVPLNRFSNKKLAMKRANTIDIPKPMKYLHDMESDSDAEERGVSSTKSIGLRGTVQVSVKTKPRQVLPAFQPKTENDIKFLQFIQKQGPTSGLGWNNPNRTVSNWTNKFGNIINSFESGAIGKPPVPASAAKNFWKKNDTQQSSGGKTSVSKVSKSTKSTGRPPWADQSYSSNVLTSALKTKERNEYSSAVHGQSSGFVQQHPQSHLQQQQLQTQQQQYPQPHHQQQQHYGQMPHPQQQIPQQHEMLQQTRQQQSPQMRQQHSPQMRQQQSPIQKQYMQSTQNHIPQQQIIKPKPISLNNFSHAPQSVFKPVDPVTPDYPEAFKPIHTDPRLHQSEPHLNYQPEAQYREQLIQENPNKPWSLVGKYSAPSSPHHSIPSPTKAWFANKNSTPSSPVTSTLPWLSKNKVDNRIRSKAEKFDKSSPPPANLQRHHSLRSKDQDYQNRMSSYDLDKVDHKRPSLPNTSEPLVNGVYQSMPFYGSNPKINYSQQQEHYQPPAPITQYQQSAPMPKYQQSVAPYQGVPQPYNTPEIIQAPLKSDYNTTPYQQPSTQYKRPPEPTYQSIPYTSTDYSEPAISTFMQPRNREESLTNPNAEPLVLTSTKPSYGPTHPLKIFDYPSPSCSISSPNFTQNDATDDDLDPECITEYKAETRVMTGPVSQQAVTVGNKTRHVGNDEKHTNDAKSLLSVMKNLAHNNLSKDKKSNEKSPNACLSPDGGSYQAPLLEPVFPEITGNVQNRMPTYVEPTQPAYKPHNTQQLPPYQTQTSNPGFTAVPQTQYQQNPTYVPPISETQTQAMYTGYPPGYKIPAEINTEVNFISNQSYQPVSELNDYHNIPQQHIPPMQQNYQYGDVRQNPTYEQPRIQNYQPIVESTQLPNYNNNTQYPDVQKNLNQHREIHDNYPKQQHEQQKRQQEQIEKPRKKSMPKVDFQDAPKSGYIPENTPKPIVQPKVTYQDLKPVKRQPLENIKTVGPVLPQAFLKPMEVDPQSPKFYQDIQPLSQSVKKPESKLVKKEPKQTQQLQKDIQETHHQQIASKQTNLYQAEQKSKVIYEQTKKQIKTSSNKVEQKQQKQQQQSEVSTKVHTQQKVFQENKMNIKSLAETQKKTTKIFSQASQEIVEKGEYKSSAPADTPDIVKSSLPKDENFPILKKFGPPQRHLYTPNAYKSPLGRSDSHSDIKPSGPIMTRKFSDPCGIAKFNAPEIVETPSTPMATDSKDEIPRNIVFNNVAQFSNMSRRISDTTEIYQKFPVPNNRPNPLSKSDSWNKICQQQNSAKPPSPKFNQSGEFGGHGLRRAKSGHTLALPKMYEAGIKREEITEKQKTVAAYFTGHKSPNSLSQSNLNETSTNEKKSISTTTTTSSTKRSSINRIRTSEKASVNKQYPSTGLSRSATMPHILNLLDEKSTTSETTKTKNDDGSVVTTTTKVTTRTVSSGSTTVPKQQVSPFAKFKQLDKQNSLTSQNSPKISITPGGANRGAPIFTFTDPTVAARAATAKEQLLHWCQMKTKEYENIQITNFSTSWNDGMAFCALIHHFLPDTFDYTKLTPKQRRYNFTLAFRVADEKAGIAPLLDVEDMVVMKRPDWKCVFTYVQSIHRHFRNCQ